MSENHDETLTNNLLASEDDDKMTTSTVNADNGGEQQDDEYFQSYFDCSVHELMIKDKPRTDGYLKSIVENAHVFKDKIVMGE